jgi:hypothetical protein
VSTIFSAICRTFISGGTRIRTGDTMIFSHMQKPLGMRIYRIGKRIYVHGVPLDTSWFCPYCCATVDTSSVTATGLMSMEELKGSMLVERPEEGYPNWESE